MKSRRCVVIQLLFAVGCALFMFACAESSLEQRVSRLPVLPPDLAATLDPKTQRTKVAPSHPEPKRDPSIEFAPCCGSQDQKSLVVRIPFTKCGPLRDFIVAPIGDAVILAEKKTAPGGQPSSPPASTTRAFRLNAVVSANVLDTIVCVTSEGPWNATLLEDRNCNGYMPVDTLVITAWDDLYSYVWNGGVKKHPADIALVSCREKGLFRYGCSLTSSCDCSSDECPPEQPCDCSAAW